MEKFLMNLSLFNDVGTLVNATGNYVNAYTGSTTSFSPPDSLTPTMKTFYDTELLENHRDQLIFAQLGRKQGLPSRRGKTIEWRKWNTLPLCAALTEGVTINLSASSANCVVFSNGFFKSGIIKVWSKDIKE